MVVENDEEVTRLEKADVIARFCSLASRVMRERFKYHIPADCFCEGGPFDPTGYEFDEQVLVFIETAVLAMLEVPPADAAVDRGPDARTDQPPRDNSFSSSDLQTRAPQPQPDDNEV